MIVLRKIKPSEKCKAVGFSLSPANIEKLDKLCKALKMNRSQLIHSLIDSAEAIDSIGYVSAVLMHFQKPVTKENLVKILDKVFEEEKPVQVSIEG